MERFGIQEIDDETRALVDTRTGEHLMTMNHDDYGWKGMDLLDDFEEILNRFVPTT